MGEQRELGCIGKLEGSRTMKVRDFWKIRGGNGTMEGRGTGVGGVT